MTERARSRTSDESDHTPSSWRRNVAKGLRGLGRRLNGTDKALGHRETILVPGFPDLFGCFLHRPDEVEFLPWNQPLHPDFEFRRTIDHGRAWSLSLDASYDEVTYIVIDLTWAANTLREMGVVISEVPLLAVQTWRNFDDLAVADGCQLCSARLFQLDDLLIAHLAGDLEVPQADLPPAPKLIWSDPPDVIAAGVLADLQARSILGESITVLNATAGWNLVPDAPTYLQVLLTNEGALRIEARKDFTYWKTEIDQPRVDRLLAGGFSDDSPWGNFEILHGPDPHGIFLHDLLTDAIAVFVQVYEPRSEKITIERIEGASPFEAAIGVANYPFSQRLIDRMFRSQLISASIERLDDIESPEEAPLLELVERLAPEFATIIKLAHLDELVDYLDDLMIFAPIDQDDALREMANDPLASPEDLSDFVLRHIVRSGDLRARIVEGDDTPSNEVVLDVESLAHERFVLTTRDDLPIAINGIALDCDHTLTADNGEVWGFRGRIGPPAQPGFVIPDLG